jgi:hypothetical protein
MICAAVGCTEPAYEPEKNSEWLLCERHMEEARAILAFDDDEGNTSDEPLR